MNLLLTGADGFIGGNFQRRLRGIKGIRCDALKGDLNDYQRAADYDAVVHLAAETGVRRSHSEPDKYWRANVAGSQRLFEQFTDTRIIYASSSSIYEWWLSPYAATKKAMEAIAPPHALGLRLHTVYAQQSRPDMFFQQLLNDQITYITSHQRDWTHVDDVIDAILLLLDYPQLTGCIDVGTGQPVSVAAVVDYYNKGPFPLREVSGERQHTCARPVELQRLGWRARRHILREPRSWAA